MKLNPKVYKNLTGEPFEIQEIDGVKVKFYDMNETQYLTQYAGQGKFAIWTSDGVDYKVLIEKSYYEALKPFYEFEVNKIWLGFLNKASDITKKINRYFMIPTLAIYLIVAVFSALYFETYMIQILLGLLVVVFLSNIFQTRITSNKIKQENINSQDEIRNAIGIEEFDALVKAQEKHYNNYFKFEEPVENTEEPEIVNENTEESNEEKDM